MEEIKEKIREIGNSLGLMQEKEIVRYCIMYAYENIIEGLEDEKPAIMKMYRSMVKELRGEVLKLNKEIIKVGSSEDIVDKLKTINNQIQTVTTMSKLDGDMHDIVMSASERIKHKLEYMKLADSRAREELQRDVFKHKVNMDFHNKLLELGVDEDE